ncbi:chloroplastic group IIA intron splicing facilitator CRS1, chloroplastic, partial [Tanacetum coccineum]
MSSTMFHSPTMHSKPFNIPKNTHPSTPQNQPNPIPDNKNHQNFNPNSATKTAPWMKAPLLLEPNQVINFTKPKPKKNKSFHKKKEFELTQKVSGGRGKQAMKKILFNIENLEEIESTHKNSDHIEFGVSLGDDDSANEGDHRQWGSRKMPWERTEKMVFRREKRVPPVTAADVTLDEVLLERLRSEARKMRSWVKVKKIGVSESVVEQIRLIWNSDELAMVKFDLPLCRNMDRAREIVETKTGGLVVWSKKDILVVYRGCNYKHTPRFSPNTYSVESSYQTLGDHDGEVDIMTVQGS